MENLTKYADYTQQQNIAASTTENELPLKNVSDLDTKTEVAVMEDVKDVYVLSKPFEYDGVTHTEVVLDYDALTGFDMTRIENEITAQGEVIITPETSTAFLYRLAARAGKVSSDLVESLPLRDFMALVRKSRNFLAGRGL